ncbi:MAG: hypothetical protein WBD30_10045 [Bacteroidota bacterium]
MKALVCTLVLVLHIPLQGLFAQDTDNSLFGTWRFVQEKSTNLATWRYRKPELVIGESSGTITIDHNWIERKRLALVDRYAFRPGGDPESIPVKTEIWTDNWYMGVLAKMDGERKVSGKWIIPGEALMTVSEEIVTVSQGEATITTTREYRINGDGNTLTLRETRSSRPISVILVFERSQPDAPR